MIMQIKSIAIKIIDAQFGKAGTKPMFSNKSAEREKPQGIKQAIIPITNDKKYHQMLIDKPHHMNIIINDKAPAIAPVTHLPFRVLLTLSSSFVRAT